MALCMQIPAVLRWKPAPQASAANCTSLVESPAAGDGNIAASTDVTARSIIAAPATAVIEPDINLRNVMVFPLVFPATDTLSLRR